nr:pantoate--beta-alanine ligase [Bradyrhizobium ivorense]
MQTITTVAELRRALGRLREGGKRVGFVPTMGYLHDGHLALVEASRAQCDVSSSIPLSSGPTRISAATSVSTT